MKDPVVMDDLIIVSRNEHGGDPRAPPPAYSGFQLVALDKESDLSLAVVEMQRRARQA